MSKKYLVLLLTLVTTFFLFGFQQAEADTTIYRLYNRQNGEHLYTTDANEKDVLYSRHGWGYEGIAWYAPDTGTPVYRLYNAGLQNHLYTSDTNEVRVLTQHHGWTSDNNGQPVFYSGGTVKIYRVYNYKLRGLHHWTTDANEYAVLPRHGWQQEGVKFYANRLGNPIQTQYAQPVAIANPQTDPKLYCYGTWTDADADAALNDPKNWLTMPDGSKVYRGPGGAGVDLFSRCEE